MNNYHKVVKPIPKVDQNDIPTYIKLKLKEIKDVTNQYKKLGKDNMVLDKILTYIEVGKLDLELGDEAHVITALDYMIEELKKGGVNNYSALIKRISEIKEDLESKLKV